MSIAKKRLAIYLAVTFGLSWGIWIPAGFILGTFTYGEASSTVMMGLITVGMFFPLVGALVANYTCGAGNDIDLGLHPHLKGNVRSYLAAWLAPAVFSVLGAVMFFVAFPQYFDPTASVYAGQLIAAGAPPELLEQLPLLIAANAASGIILAPFINTIPAFGEEAGWRGMLFPTLCELVSPRAAVLISGVIWGVWHAPAIAMGHNYGMGYEGFPWVGILLMTTFCIVVGAFLSYLRVRTNSVWPCALAHGSINAIAGIGLYFSAVGSTLAGPAPVGYIGGIPLLILAVVCWLKIEKLPRAEL